MDFGRLFQSAEDAVYEVMVWILLLPKTLFRSMFRPKSAIKDLITEWEKKPDERFDEYLSPVLLWLIVAVIPLSLIAIYITGNANPNLTKEISEKILPMTLYAMIVPFTYIVWMETVNKRPVKKSTLKRSFYMHCNALAPSQILTVLFLILGLFLAFMDLVLVGILILLIAFFTIPFYEGFVFQFDLETSYIKAFLYTLVPQVVLVSVLLIILAADGGFGF